MDDIPVLPTLLAVVKGPLPAQCALLKMAPTFLELGFLGLYSHHHNGPAHSPVKSASAAGLRLINMYPPSSASLLRLRAAQRKAEDESQEAGPAEQTVHDDGAVDADEEHEAGGSA